MIRIVKPETGPPILSDPTKRGPKETATLEALYDAGTRDFTFEADIYGAKSVKKKLSTIQHAKCVFCESKIEHISYGDVEHYRPKGGYQQNEDDELTQPGYYWLAYYWANLFLSCQICNQRHKKNLFPLADPDARARSHHDDVAGETPLFIHPVLDNPTEFIGFREEYAFSIDDNVRGTATISGLATNREELVEMRRDRFRDVKLLVDSYVAVPPGTLRDDIEARLRELVAPDAQYSAMNTAAIGSVL